MRPLASVPFTVQRLNFERAACLCAPEPGVLAVAVSVEGGAIQQPAATAHPSLSWLHAAKAAPGWARLTSEMLMGAPAEVGPGSKVPVYTLGTNQLSI